MSALVVKAKTIKDKGIALCHESQGYSANMRPVSLLMKSDLAPEQITKDVVKALRQVTVDMSFEEFLRRFFDMWSSDAELLAKLLGFETELENAAAENPDDEWLQRWNDDNQEWLESKMESISIAKAANAGEELDLVKQYELIKLQQMFEKGVAEHGVIFDAKDTQETEVIKDAAKPDVPVQNTIENKETSVSDTVDVTKSQEYLDLVKKLEEANAKNAQAELIIKAAVEAEKKNALTKAKGFTFAAEEDHESLADFIIEKANAPVVALLEKAQARISELETEVETVKKEFGTQENGINQEVVTEDLAKSAEDVLKANVQKALEAARARKTA
ncbi:hypothetical protein KP12_130 [Klebsiella phage KP12]|jgi:hypothetical protein|uniref:Head stabilization/decoration protein n=7 Tax=Caudoviricetes TaxID=2731619 RepID=A0A3G8F1J0_9CAUD|nr:hypothetical protein KB57_073 [Klebsiella phage vB_KpnM_KB57]YP_009832556.1 hypothetical protein BIS47_49 [Klebsiella phage vB_KpnM_BIS47]YP_009842407.1 hypothetical protein HWB97_gp246 [Proteus phage Mydo]YP_009859119.1 hypothetical protein HWD29_gp073 [Klebsiella phage KpS8]YP_009966173.1 hypothetical protein HWB02_gp058 [Klebsiella phage KNP2]QKE60503.1 hypothetical protein KPP_1731 [Klebsiella phage KPP-1]QOI68648.1 hypothetical protein phage621_00071 [Klebsiella phage vB_KpnM_Seu621]